jgi:uncharacterized membrane protein
MGVYLHHISLHVFSFRLSTQVAVIPTLFKASLPIMATTGGIEVLSNGIGYGIVVGIGAFFALLMYVTFSSIHRSPLQQALD